MTDIIDDWSEIFNLYKQSNPNQKRRIKNSLKDDMKQNELAFIMGRWPPPMEEPRNERKGEELGFFKKELCKICNSQIMARFWNVMFNESIEKAGLCERCTDEGYIAELKKESDRKYREENR